MNLHPSFEWTPNDAPVILRFNHTDIRELFEVYYQVGGKVKPIFNETSMFDLSNVTYGDYHQDHDNKQLYLGVDGSMNGTIQLNPIRCRLTCPDPLNECVKEDFIRKWSD